MSNIVHPPGVPCWVETLQADPESAIAFYSGLFGREALGPGSMPSGGQVLHRTSGRTGRCRNCDSSKSYGGAPAWTTYVRVDDADAATERATNAGASVVAPRSTHSPPAAAPYSGPGRRGLRRAATARASRCTTRQYAERVGDESAAHARPEALANLLRKSLRLESSEVRRGPGRNDALPPTRLRRRHGTAARFRATSSLSWSPPTTDRALRGMSAFGSTTLMPRPARTRELGGRVLKAPQRHADVPASPYSLTRGCDLFD